MMKRIFTLITSIVLATSLLAVPCFAAEPEDLPAPQPGVTETEQPDGSVSLRIRTDLLSSHVMLCRALETWVNS